VAIPSYTVYLLGTVLGYLVSFGIPTGFEEGIRFIFPSYLTAILAAELREPRAILLVVTAFMTTPLCEAAVPGWGLIVNAAVVATVAVGVETWLGNASPSS
jgi:predicted branched-subunit amino acid permease